MKNISDIDKKFIDLIKESGEFDEKYYLQQYPDVKKNGIDPLYHFYFFGGKELRNPNKFFNTENFVKEHSNIKDSIHPFVYYLLNINKLESNYLPNYIDKEIDFEKYSLIKIKTSHMFDYDFYRKKYNLNKLSDNELIIHFLKKGTSGETNPNRFFSTSFYLNKYDDVKKAKLNPLIHYIDHGIKEGREINEYSLPEKIYAEQQNYYGPDSYKKIIEKMEFKPEFSIIMPMYESNTNLLIKAIESLKNQYYKYWHLYAIDDGSTDKRAHDIMNNYANKDKRINFIRLNENMGISYASNKALSYISNDYVALLDHDDELTPDALFYFAISLNKNRNLEIIYSDECIISEDGYKIDRFLFKPDFSPEMLISGMYTGHLSVYKTELIHKAGGFRSNYDFSQDYDLALRCFELTDHIYHIEKILYLWRMSEGSAAQAGQKDYARISNYSACKAAMERRKINCSIIQENWGNRIISWMSTKVSIIIPSDNIVNIKRSIENIHKLTLYKNYEILIVTNSKVISILDPLFSHYGNIIFVPFDETFNFSKKCNHGAMASHGDILIFYNDDIEIFDNSWLINLITPLSIKEVGAVNPLVLNADRKTIQAFGMGVNLRPLFGSCLGNIQINDEKIFPPLEWLRNSSIIFGACGAIRKELFHLLGGFDEINTPNCHSDVDISFRLRELNYRIVVTPFSKVIHYAHNSWHDIAQSDKDANIYILKKYPQFIKKDIYFTNSMKMLSYYESPEYNIYSPESMDKSIFSKHNIVIFSHDMGLTGAPIALFHLAKLLIDSFFIVVITPQKGPLIQKFIDEGMYVIYDPNMSHILYPQNDFFKSFDFAIVNCLDLANIIAELQSYMKVFWWIHEGKYGIKHFMHNLAEYIDVFSSNNVIPVSVSSYTKDILYKRLNVNCKYIMPYPDTISIKQKENCLSKKTKKEIFFAIIGTIEPRKGHDIFIDAIMELHKSYLEHSQFIIIGKENKFEKDYMNKLKNKSSILPQIKFLGEVDRETLATLYEDIDVVVLPTHDDPLPVVIYEAIYNKKICIISKNNGFYSILSKDTNSYILKTNTSTEIKLTIESVIDNWNNISKNKAENPYNYILNQFNRKKIKNNFMRIVANEHFFKNEIISLNQNNTL